jgi:hypothetical protein
MLPQSRGAEWFLATVAEPRLAPYEDRIDRELGAMRDHATQASARFMGYLRIVIAEGLRNVSDQVRDDLAPDPNGGKGDMGGWVEAVGPLENGDPNDLR